MEEDNKYLESAMRGAISQGVAAAAGAGFGGIMALVGFPQAVIAAPLVEGGVLGIMDSYYEDFNARQLSRIENGKMYQFFKVAANEFFNLATKDGKDFNTPQIENSQLENAYEVAEEAVLTSIRQSERKKIVVIGRYFGSRLYYGDCNWQDMHQMLTMAGTLSLRQLVMIRLIVEGFDGIDKNLAICNPFACVDMNMLQNYGLWHRKGSVIGFNSSNSIKLDDIIPTDFCKKVYVVLKLQDFSIEDVQRTIENLDLKPIGVKSIMITPEDYDNHITNGVTKDDVMSKEDIDNMINSSLEFGEY